MEVRSVRVGDVNLSIAEAGAGGRPLLLVHGFTGAKEDFVDFLDPLAALGWWAVAPDNRGHGDSDKPGDESSYSLDIYAADVRGLADALEWDQFALLGHSMGGMIAQVVAGQVPERVERLILMDTAHGGLRLGDRDTLGAAIHIVRTRGIDGLIEAMAARGDDPLASPAHLRLLDEKPGYREFGERKLRAASPAMYVAMLTEMGEQADRLDALAGLKMPSLVLVGEQDAPFIRPSERMADVLPDASLTVIPDAGHSPQFENPSAWWAAIETFLAT